MTPKITSCHLIVHLWLGLFALCSTASAQIFVTSTADSGPGTLRQAILDANAIPVATEEIVTIDLQGIQNGVPSPGRATVACTSQIVMNRSVNITASGILPKPIIGLAGLTKVLNIGVSTSTLKIILQNLRFEGCRATLPGGAISCLPGAGSTNLEIIGCEFVDNQSSPPVGASDPNGRGAAILFEDTVVTSPSSLKLTQCLFENNRAISSNIPTQERCYGAAVCVKGVQVIIEDSQFVGNACNALGIGLGGALYISGSLGTAEVRRCTFDSNSGYAGNQSAPNTTSALVYIPDANSDSLLVEDSMFENNSGSNTVYLPTTSPNSSGSATFRNTTFVKNSGVVASVLQVYTNFGNVFLTHCTIWNNVHATNTSSAVFVHGTGNIVTFSRSVIAGNRHVSDEQANASVDLQQYINGSNCLASAGYNYIGDASWHTSVFAATGDRRGTSSARLVPGLAEAGNYGGPTRTCPPLPNSPLVDYIPLASNVLATDQRGITRPQGSASDIGAVELPRVSYDVWDNQISQEKDRGATADPDKDGLPNKLEYFFGTDPTVANAAPVSMVENEDGRFVEILRSTSVRPLVFTRTDVETSIDLSAGSWSSLTGTTVSSPEVEGSLGRIRTLYPVGSDPRRFFRVAVE